MNYLIWTYVLYTSAAIGLTGVLAQTLFRNGAVFLDDVFEDKPSMANAINHLLVVGFYMLNLGYAFLIFETNGAETALEATEVLVTKLGLLLVSLGVIHFVNMAVFWRIRRSGEPRDIVPPPPTFVPPPPKAPAPAPVDF
jgi:cation transporter-like permease